MSFQVCAKRCDECLFSNAKIVSDRRKAEVLRTCVKNDSHFVCHKFTKRDSDSQVCCRGFYDRDIGATNPMRIAGRLGAVEFVELPEEKP